MVSRSLVVLGIVVVAVAWLLARPLPHPYEATPLHPIPEARQRRLLNGLTAHKALDEVLGSARVRHLNADNVVVLFNGLVHGAESVAIVPSVAGNGKGSLAMLDRYGRLHTAPLPTSTGKSALQGVRLANNPARDVVVGPGRPLGFHFTSPTTFVACVAPLGLVEATVGNETFALLATRDATGRPIAYANDVDVNPTDADDIFFTSSTAGTVAYNARDGYYDTMRSYILNFYSGDATGRLLRYRRGQDAARPEVVVDGLWYANGVAVAPDATYVLVAETSQFRVVRHWLTGAKAGATETFMEGLPGFPDGITRSSDGHFWISLVAPVSPLVKFIGRPWVRALLSFLHFDLDVTKYFLKKWACVLKVTPSGTIVEALLDRHGDTLSTVSAVTEHDGVLYFGNLGGEFVSAVAL